MKFGDVPVGSALGTILAHSVAVAQGRLRKGKTLSTEDLTALAESGYHSVTVARLGDTDQDEDSAALALARALVPDPDAAGLSLNAVGTGRVNILAASAGIAQIDATRIHAVNSVDPALTVATVPKWHRLEPGGMVATVKIIPYGVDRMAVSTACAAGLGAVSLRQPVLAQAAFIETSLGGAATKGHRVTADRLARLGVTLGPAKIVEHNEAALAHALTQTDAPLILILTASATSDARDTAPEALRKAGGTVTHFGMPVDPGNLLIIGHLGASTVIGLPGCAKSPALNGADWVMERVICGVPVSAADIQGMGVGGLLKEIPSRPRPRESRS